MIGPRFNSWINVYEKNIIGRRPAFGIGLNMI
jgi:hypothetical protein